MPRDITIVGGGLIGLCAALVLQHPQRRILVLEANSVVQQHSNGLNARSIALSTSSVQILRALGIWPSIQALSTPIRHIHISSRGRWGVTRLQASDYQLDALGYVVESQALGRCLLEAVETSANIEFQRPAEFESIQQNSTVNIGYRYKGKLEKIECRLALIADGAQSKARKALDIGHQTIDYGQSLILCNVEVSKPCIDTAYERFTDQGPLAMLPLGGNRYACVWTQNPRLAEQAVAQPETDFIAPLQACFGLRLGYIERVGTRFSIPIERIRAEKLQQRRCFLVGNAANALHPVAGQSFNLALRDIACLYELLAEHQLSSLDNERLNAIAGDFEQLRAKEQQAVIRMGDGLVSLFSNNLPLFNTARAAGLSMLDVLPSIKTQVALAGMGMTFGGNRLLRGHL